MPSFGSKSSAGAAHGDALHYSPATASLFIYLVLYLGFCFHFVCGNELHFLLGLALYEVIFTQRFGDCQLFEKDGDT